jgi:hypothetical protein
MLLTKKVKASLVGLVVAGGAAAAMALGPAGLAVGQSSSPTVGQSSPPGQLQLAVNYRATLVANGAGVDVFVTIRCPGPEVVSGSVAIIGLTERVGKYLATGGPPAFPPGNAGTVDCTGGTAQTIVLLEIANPAVKAFVQGTAVAQVTFSACDAEGACASPDLQPTIRIRS